MGQCLVFEATPVVSKGGKEHIRVVTVRARFSCNLPSANEANHRKPRVPYRERCPVESQSKPGIKMVYPEPCKELRRRPQLFLAGTAPYKP